MPSIKDLIQQEIRRTLTLATAGFGSLVFLIGVAVVSINAHQKIENIKQYITQLGLDLRVFMDPLIVQRSLNAYWPSQDSVGGLLKGVKVFHQEQFLAEVGNFSGWGIVSYQDEISLAGGQFFQVQIALDVSTLVFFFLGLSVLLCLMALGIFYFRTQNSARVIDSLLAPLVQEIQKVLAVQENPDTKAVSERGARKPHLIQEVESLAQAYEKHIVHLEQVAKIREKSNYVEMARQVAHDIRSPVATLGIMVSTLDSLPQEKSEIIQDSIRRIKEIANDLVNKSKSNLEAPSTQNLAALVEPMLREKSVALQKTSIEILAELDRSIYIRVNGAIFLRVLSNLLNNSIEAIENKAGKIFIRAFSENYQAVLEIQDSGKGIPEAILKQLGNEGFSSGKTQDSGAGSGLGIYHAQESLRMWNGHLEIKSQEGLGTTLRIVLPVVQA